MKTNIDKILNKIKELEEVLRSLPDKDEYEFGAKLDQVLSDFRCEPCAKTLYSFMEIFGWEQDEFTQLVLDLFNQLFAKEHIEICEIELPEDMETSSEQAKTISKYGNGVFGVYGKWRYKTNSSDKNKRRAIGFRVV